MIRVLFIRGISDDLKAKVFISQKKTFFNAGGSCNVFNYIDSSYFDKYLLTIDARPNVKNFIKNIDKIILFNQISDADSHTITLSKVNNMVNKFNLICINHPKKIMETTRDKIYQKLKDINKLIVPKTISVNSRTPNELISSIKNANIQYPIILRECGAHGGVTTYLLKNPQEIRELYAIALDGRGYYITQYHEYKDSDGLYSKIRLVVVDGEVYLRHILYANEWIVHASNDIINHKMRLEISKNFISEIKPQIEPIITEIYNVIGLDYFGIDCHIDRDMNMTIFEVNANMNVFIATENSIFIEHIEMIREALVQMILKKGNSL